MSTPLFTAPDEFAARGLAHLFRAIDEVMPMNGAQKRDLPMACRDLSAMLTTDRDSLDRPYWTAPRLTSAYLRYFLPWNLVRLSSLLPGLDFGRIPDEPLILDMGSGPLTLPLALWLSRPDLRDKPVTIVASDTTPHILELGRRLFESLKAELAPECRWTIRTMRASVTQALHRLHAKPGTLWMMTTGNVLNEMEEKRARPGHQMSDRMRSLLEDAARMLMDEGLIFSVEPGTRQGGRLLSNLRKSALGGAEEEPEFEDLTSFALREEQAERATSRAAMADDEDDWDDDDFVFGLEPLFMPLSPCPHAHSCPMLDRRTTAWCHVNAPAEHAPHALRDLSARAGLDKDSISLSFLLLRKLREEDAKRIAEGAENHARRPQTRRQVTGRIVSDAFIVPDYPGRARYACTEYGLALIPDSSHLAPGSLCKGWTTPWHDRKSQAFIMMLDDAEQRAPRRREMPQDRQDPRHAHSRQNFDAARRTAKEEGRRPASEAPRRDRKKERRPERRREEPRPFWDSDSRADRSPRKTRSDSRDNRRPDSAPAHRKKS